MKKIRIFLATFAALSLILFGSIQPAMASDVGGSGHGDPGPSNVHGRIGVVKTKGHVSANSVVNCSTYGCDNDYAYNSNSQTPGTNCGASGSFVGWFGGEGHWSQIYYSKTCNTNWAYVSSPDGSQIMSVTLWRRPSASTPTYLYGSVQTVSQHGACASRISIGGNPDPNQYCDADTLAGGQTTFMSNMLYAPVDQVQLCVYTQNNNGAGYCSYWH